MVHLQARHPSLILLRLALARLTHHWRPLLAFHLIFAGVALALIAPLFTLATGLVEPVTGRAAISTGGMIRFVFSAGGFAWLLTTISLSVLTFILQQHGLSLIAHMPDQRPVAVQVLSALWGTTRHLRPLAAIAVIKTLSHLLLALPFLAMLAFAYQQLLAPYDLYFLRLEQPPVLWWFCGIAAILLTLMVLAHGWLFLRWLLAVPLLLPGKLDASAALRTSAHRMRGQRRALVLPLAAGGLILATLPPVFSLIYRAVIAPILDWLPGSPAMISPVMIGLLVAYLLVTLFATFVGSAGFSLLTLSASDGLSGRAAGASYDEESPSAVALNQSRRMAWVTELLVVLVIASQAWLIIDRFSVNDQVANTAHRGASILAPENSLSAIRQAIEDGADFIEIDVRLTADGVPILWHDRDMQRIFGVDDTIAQVYLDQLLELDAGSWFSPDFAGERVVTLQEAIDEVRGRARLYVDLKPDLLSKGLTHSVVKLLQSNGIVDQSVLAAAYPSVLREAKSLEPALQTTLLAQFVVGPLDHSAFDNLGLRHNRVSAATVAEAHRKGYELHVWTVNNPAEMGRFIDMGVDNIITDRPDLLTRVLAERRELSATERLMVKLHNWLR